MRLPGFLILITFFEMRLPRPQCRLVLRQFSSNRLTAVLHGDADEVLVALGGAGVVKD